MTTESVWMTSASRERLADELAGLERTAPADAESQIRMARLRELLRNAEVGSKPDDGLVEPGMRVTVRFDHDGSSATFLLGSRELAQFAGGIDVEIYSPTSPLGAAIMGRYVGDSVTFSGPTRQQQITIESAIPFS